MTLENKLSAHRFKKTGKPMRDTSVLFLKSVNQITYHWVSFGVNKNTVKVSRKHRHYRLSQSTQFLPFFVICLARVIYITYQQ